MRLSVAHGADCGFKWDRMPLILTLSHPELKTLPSAGEAPELRAPTEWQKCPVCDGQGLVNRPPHIAGDQMTWSSTNAAPHPCRRCIGTGTILRPDGECLMSSGQRPPDQTTKENDNGNS